MEERKQSIIDNWSLQHAGTLLDQTIDYSELTVQKFEDCLGGLSNYINAILFYDDSSYLDNGFIENWTKFPWFEKNTKLILNPINPKALGIDWNSEASYSDQGIRNYLLTSQYFKSDLYISPERSKKIIDHGAPMVDSAFCRTLEKIDTEIKSKKDESWFNEVKIGIEHNFKIPTLTHYVFSKASNTNDLLTVIMQLKTDGTIKKIRSKIYEISQDTKQATSFRKEVEKIIAESFGEHPQKDKPFSFKISALFLSYDKKFSLDFFRRKSHVVFLKDLINCRTEAFSLNKDIQRIFKRKI